MSLNIIHLRYDCSISFTDTFQVRFAMRHCSVVDYGRHTAFKCHHEPFYLLAHDCSRIPHTPMERRDCKLDESLDYLLNSTKDQFAATRYVLFASDDMYVRPDQLVRWLKAVDRSGVAQYPIIASSDKKLSRRSGLPGVEGCSEIRTRTYSLPFALNHAMLEKMRPAVGRHGIQSLTSNFNTTYDVAVGVLAWMLGANHMLMASVNDNPLHRGALGFKPADMLMLHVRRSPLERCDDGKDSKWQMSERFEQSVVIGCGDLARPAPRHLPIDGADMYDAWEYFKKHGKDIPLGQAGVNGFVESHVLVDAEHTVRHVLHATATGTWEANLHNWHTYFTGHVYLFNGTRHEISRGERLTTRVVPRLMPLTGYSGTTHSARYEATHEWLAYSLRDCSVGGLRGRIFQ